MKNVRSVVLITGLVAAAFLAGLWMRSPASGDRRPQAARKILYWVDPMHPSYKSDKPGVAPDCGMALEPVYADDTAAAAGPSAPANAVTVSLEKQQVIGVKLGRVETVPLSRTIATVGRVAVDETRVYKVVVNAEGRVRELSPIPSGTLVTKDQLLLYVAARDVLTAEQSFFYGLWAVDRYKAEGTEGPDQMKIAEGQVKAGSDALANYGMSARQIEELRRTRTPTTDIEVRSPVTGYVLARNVFPSQRYESGSELFRVADLSRVWVLADVFPADVGVTRPGMPARVVLPGVARTEFQGRITDALPSFDIGSRTFKVRIEVGNAEYLLRPDMLVDVQVVVPLPTSLSVPAEAIVDSGNRRIVFVDRGNGFFEPRNVETGWRVGDRVQIVRGLMESDTIVVSGNFLLDSEARMRAAATGVDRATSQTDPVCGMEVDPARARAAGRTVTVDGETYYFCSEQCKEQFAKDAQRYRSARRPQAAEGGRGPAGRPGESTVPGVRAAAVVTTRPPEPSTPPQQQAIDSKTPPGSSATASAVPSNVSALTGVPWPTDDQYIPKNKRLRQPGGSGTPMQLAQPLPRPADPAGRADVSEATAPTPAGASATVKDPVCGMDVDRAAANQAGRTTAHAGVTYFFCSDDCKKQFDAEPGKFVKK